MPIYLDHPRAFTSGKVSVLVSTIKPLGCVDKVEYTAIYSWLNDINALNLSQVLPCTISSTYMLNCTLSLSTVMATVQVISNQNGHLFTGRLGSNYTTIWRTNQNRTISLYLFIGWRQLGSASWAAIESAPLVLTLRSNSTNSSTSNGFNDILVHNSSADCTCNELPDHCSAAAVCNLRDFTCLNNKTTEGSANCYGINGSLAVKDLFTVPDCNNHCANSSSSSLPINSTALFELDANGQCCSLNSIDCLGYCYGASRVAYANDAAGLTCCSAFEYSIDCAGVCNGNAIINGCGICTTTDPDGTSCFNASAVYASTESTNRNELYPVFDFSSFGNSQNSPTISYICTTTTSVMLVNQSPYTAAVAVDVSDPTSAPAITLSSSLEIAPRSSLNLPVSISLLGLVNGSVFNTWAVKTITFTFTSLTHGMTVSSAIQVYPTVTGCQSLTLYRAACIRVPGCIYCLQVKGPLAMRSSGQSATYLQPQSRPISPRGEEEGADAEGSVDVDAGTGLIEGVRRRLFASFIPSAYSNPPGNILSGGGYCVEGWQQEACDD